ncbi:DUF3604 domain-containing protein [uncultured Erythrobacter sp.]|uniref:DUF3604 domain-containing protein n=1 Tax=uncultured Erythrobacter sp. TaxID=263913 RepID=UPI00260E9F57|nr:DUF3604 domain-containing protein [uncultured Erythrobacter sp.]
MPKANGKLSQFTAGRTRFLRTGACVFAVFAAPFSLAGCSSDPVEDVAYESAKDVPLTEYPERVYWGDLHLHTLYSFDSYNFGNKTLGPDEAYRFAKGEPIEAHTGDIARLSAPLDFLMISDHAEYTGVFLGIENGNPDIVDTALGRAWAAMESSGDTVGPMDEVVTSLREGRAERDPPEAFKRTIWSELVEAAERHYEPGRFTTFAGYEWTSMPGGGNQHRVVVFKDGMDKTLQTIPFSAADGNNPMQLWDYLQRYEQSTGGEVMAIAHNGNISNGNMFGDIQVDGQPFDEAYVTARARWEPLYEMTQVKGDSEAHPLLSPTDEFADFETWDQTNISMEERPEDVDARRAIFANEYAREALKQGLDLQARFGVNPYQFGLIGSTDSHTGLATADDDNFWGKFVESEPGPDRISSKMGGRLWDNWRLTSSGYIGAWARGNTREELFAAFKRREVYATTGPRISLRFFAGWDFTQSDASIDGLAEAGYDRGVPMGSIITGDGDAPSFLVYALKDPNGAHLDRVQVIKGWRDAAGELHEKIYNVAFAGDRIVDPADGGIDPIGSTVNLSDATYTNDIGEPQLSTVWKDPDFDPTVPSFYYVRVIEIPTPRWTLYDAVRFGVTPPSEVPLITQERAYSSPIWYQPQG